MKTNKQLHPMERRWIARSFYRKAGVNVTIAWVLLTLTIANAVLDGPWLLWVMLPLIGLCFAAFAGVCFCVARWNDD